MEEHDIELPEEGLGEEEIEERDTFSSEQVETRQTDIKRSNVN